MMLGRFGSSVGGNTCRTSGAVTQPYYEHGGCLHFMLRTLRPGEVKVPCPGSLRQPVIGLGPSPGHLTGEPLLSPVLPASPIPEPGAPPLRAPVTLGGLGDLSP